MSVDPLKFWKTEKDHSKGGLGWRPNNTLSMKTPKFWHEMVCSSDAPQMAAGDWGEGPFMATALWVRKQPKKRNLTALAVVAQVRAHV